MFLFDISSSIRIRFLLLSCVLNSTKAVINKTFDTNFA
jgi:hypothetical protein